MALSKLADIREQIYAYVSEADLTDRRQLTLALVGVVGATYLLYRVLRPSSEPQYPPGPFRLPVLGNLHQVVLSGNLVKFLEKYRKIYGNWAVYTVELGGVKRVVVSGYDAMHELLEKNADYISNRTTLTMPANYSEVAKDTPGLFWAEYPHWKTMRSFALTQLREEGMGKSQLEPKIMEEFHFYVEHFISPNLGKPVDLSESMNLATGNVISLLLFAKRLPYTDDRALRWKRAFDKVIANDLKASICRNLPLAKYLPGDPAGLRANQNAGNFVVENSALWVKEVRESLDLDCPLGFVDSFLAHAERLREEQGDVGCFTDGNAAIASMQLYGAGLETTATTLRWALLYMAVYPEVQEKVKAEIDRVIGEREVTYKDRLDLPYVEAISQEVLRRSNIGMTALPHTAEKTFVIEGKVIPAGSELMLNMASVLHEESVFEEPDRFKPERFLTGDVELKKSHNIPFGMGRRVCLGRDLARMEFFLFFVTFMQRFNVTYDGDTPPSLVGNPGFVNSPHPHKLIFTSR